MGPVLGRGAEPPSRGGECWGGTEPWQRGARGRPCADGTVCPQCITDWHRQNGFASSLELPDNTLNFAKKHPLMDEPILPHRGRPLLLKKDANFTQLVVDRVSGLDGTIYEVLFIGTGTCRAAGGTQGGLRAWGRPSPPATACR